MKIWANIARALEAGEPCALVTVFRVEGSAPREVGARLVLNRQGFHGTIGGGALFLIIKAIEWTGEIQHGYTITANTFWSFYYTAAGLHAFHVIAGMVLLGFVAKDAAKNLELHRVELIGIYWHFVDVVWIFLFPLLYIAK